MKINVYLYTLVYMAVITLLGPLNINITVADIIDCKEYKKVKECLSTREYITTYNYLKKHKEFFLKKKDIYFVANKVSMGCSKAAERFIKINDLLIAAKLGTKEAIEVAIKFALSDDIKTKTFIIVFKNAYLQTLLDLDLMSAINVALSLSLEFNGDHKELCKDYKKLTKFCVSTDGLDLSRPVCAKVAAKMTLLGEKFHKGVSKKFIEIYKFLISKKGPAKSSREAITIAQEIISNGPIACDNFIEAYKFAMKESGLNLDKNNAFTLAMKMAKRSFIHRKQNTQSLKCQRDD